MSLTGWNGLGRLQDPQAYLKDPNIGSSHLAHLFVSDIVMESCQRHTIVKPHQWWHFASASKAM